MLGSILAKVMVVVSSFLGLTPENEQTLVTQVNEVVAIELNTTTTIPVAPIHVPPVKVVDEPVIVIQEPVVVEIPTPEITPVVETIIEEPVISQPIAQEPVEEVTNSAPEIPVYKQAEIYTKAPNVIDFIMNDADRVEYVITWNQKSLENPDVYVKSAGFAIPVGGDNTREIPDGDTGVIEVISYRNGVEIGRFTKELIGTEIR
jgi:hypothetical protein